MKFVGSAGYSTRQMFVASIVRCYTFALLSYVCHAWSVTRHLNTAILNHAYDSKQQ
jgi:hypothetical protein